jgi:hypothetical protein
MSWDPWNLKVEVLEQFAEHRPVADLRGGWFCFYDPERARENVAAWKAAHPLLVREYARRSRARRGVGTKVGRPSRAFVDQHGNRYGSLREAAAKLNLNHVHVWAVLRGLRRSTKGYRFRYEA